MWCSIAVFPPGLTERSPELIDYGLCFNMSTGPVDVGVSLTDVLCLVHVSVCPPGLTERSPELIAYAKRVFGNVDVMSEDQWRQCADQMKVGIPWPVPTPPVRRGSACPGSPQSSRERA